MKPLVSALAILVFATTGIAHAQYAALLSIPVDARSIGMGSSGVADNSVPGTIFFNPANVVADPRAYLDANYETLSSDWSADSWVGKADGGIAWKSGDASAWTFATNVAYSKSQVHRFYAGGDDQLWSLAIGAGYAVDPNWQLRFGAAVKRVNGTIVIPQFNGFEYDDDYDGYKYDFGAATSFAKTTSSEWTVEAQFGFSLLNHGSDISGAHISIGVPARTVIGASFEVTSPLRDLMGARVPLFASTLDFDTILQDGETAYGTGIEVAVAQILFARIGTQIFPGNYYSDSQTPWGMGVGLPVGEWRFRFDYGNRNIENHFEEGVLSLLALKDL